eukprot:CAMPEP_0198609420 /NCGR_PEP_ID=MMETSP1462-20131121/156385_1 /TAXON_ID=1333877 /ORGANISM="Brandtodinium nutriculum, Strain RCC3387" /LENGTH=454 /DNA_ID=CAMNT_0044341225 /DNA_START=73 /DNA_END=1435 /DNA_ORIENTATION=+
MATRCSRRIMVDAVLTTRAFKMSFIIAFVTGLFSGGLYYVDQIVGLKIVEQLVPTETVWQVFLTFLSLVLAFRTAHALSRFTDAAMYVHKLSACWFDTASTLIAFCRVSKAPAEQIEAFQQTVVRLVSILNALSLDSLQDSEGPSEIKHRFEVLGAQELDADTQTKIVQSDHRVELVFQMIQQLVVDNIETGVLTIQAPILTRSFQDMADALLTYHEARKLAFERLPFAYIFITAILLLAEAIGVPFMMILYTKGLWSSFFFTFCCTFLHWFMNGVSDDLDNPFRRESRALDASQVQHELNGHLLQLLEQRHAAPVTYTAGPTPLGQQVAAGAVGPPGGAVFQMIQQLVVDNIENGVLSIPPPILTRSFQHMADALLTYKEARKFAFERLPFPYVFITAILLLAEAVGVPFMMILYTKGLWSSFFFTFCCTFLHWFMNGVSADLDNPFRRESRA